MQYFLQNNNSYDLIIFFCGWGCDENQFTNLKDDKDVLILYDYQNLDLDFDFSKYKNIYLIAYSAGVFISSIIQNKIPNLRKKVAICGNPYLFDEKLGLSLKTIDVLKSITLENYLDFRRKYMVETDDEFKQYNALQSMRSIESCENELLCLQDLYNKYKKEINPDFDVAFIAEKDVLFGIAQQKDFYKEKLCKISNAKHHIFFKFRSFAEFLL